MLLQTFAGVLGEKICMCAILKENTATYISLESLINVDFGKNGEFSFNQSEALPISGWCTSSVWNFCACYSDVVLWGIKWQPCKMLAVFSGYGCCNSVILREDFVYNCQTSMGARWHCCAALRTTCSFCGTYSYALLLQLAVTDAWMLSNV